MMTDPIADMLTRIRNASMARHDRVELPHSHIKESLASVMKAEGYIDDVRVSEGEDPRMLTLVLRYGRERQSAIDGLRRVSTPGRRVYVRHERVCSGMGISILSTSRGLMTDREARRQRAGGELLCEVW
jgi:small subunit ribosomal protein S8